MTQRPNTTANLASDAWPCFGAHHAYIKDTIEISRPRVAAMTEFAKRGDIYIIKPKGAGSARSALFLSSIGGGKTISGSVKGERGS
ncbi:MAG: hypothetical protein AAF936_18155 [Pseudomonadota bacterium]